MAEQSRKTQVRGRLRRRQLMDAGRQLLAERSIDEVGLPDIAERAGIPLTSTYNLFENKNALFAAIAEECGAELNAALAQPYRQDGIESWRDILARAIERGADWYDQNPEGMQLLIGPKSPPDIKLSDRDQDMKLGRVIAEVIDCHFVLPVMEDRAGTFFHFVEIADLMLSLSVIYHGHMTDEMTRQAKIAGIRYVGAFLPEYLPRRPQSADNHKPTRFTVPI